MKKFLLFMGGAAIGLAVLAQSLPRPVYLLDFEGARADGKYIEDGRIVIVKNGVKCNVAGQTIK